MRLIGELNEAKKARQFAAYLLTQGIASKVELEGDVWEVWVKDEDQLELAVKELDDYQKDPEHERYRDSLGKAEEIAREEEKRRRQYQKNMVDVRAAASPHQRSSLTILLIVLCGLVALATNFASEKNRTGVVFRALTFTAIESPASVELLQKHNQDLDNLNVRVASIKRGEVWRAITPIFIHHTPMHLVFNMIWLFQFGRMIESRYGTFWLAMLVIASAALPNLVQSMVPDQIGGSQPYFDGEYLLAGLGGMSGVVYGLFGFIWMKSLYDPSSRFHLQQSTVVILIAWLFICMIFIGNIANWAHAIGLLVGMAAGYLPTMLAGGQNIGRT